MQDQLIFNFGQAQPKYASIDFIPHSGNQQAYDYLITSSWATPTTIIFGPKCSGKTYLANLWATQNCAFYVTPLWLQTKELLISNLFDEKHRAFVVDDLELFLGSIELEGSIFHLYNYCLQNHKKLLITSSQSPSNIHFQLPDLASRLRASTALELQEPNDQIKEILVSKFFSDFQLLPDLGIVKYMLRHGPRSLVDLNKCVQAIHECSMQKKKKVSIGLVKEVLEKTKN